MRHRGEPVWNYSELVQELMRKPMHELMHELIEISYRNHPRLG